ncbi:hypothetical protein BDV06DRAFT_234527 [Aspergillus oleicola]
MSPLVAIDQVDVPHLAFSPPSRILQMKDLALEPTVLSLVATTNPFPLLSHEAVLAHRRALFSPEVRGMAPRYAPFICQFWHSPEVLKTISDIAGVELVPALDFETSHTNVQLGPDGVDGVRARPIEPPIATLEAIRKSDGSTLKVRAPQMGSAMLLQRRYITHTAAPVTNMPERVTIVTSFRPKDPMLLDETTRANIRNKSHLSELYYQWMTYRLDVLAGCARIAADAVRKRYEENTVNVAEIQEWAGDQMAYIQQTLHEMRLLV